MLLNSVYVRYGERILNIVAFWWSVIHGYGTYGGFSSIDADRGLLEVMSDAINNGEPIGWLTAERVMQYVKGE